MATSAKHKKKNMNQMIYDDEKQPKNEKVSHIFSSVELSRIFQEPFKAIPGLSQGSPRALPGLSQGTVVENNKKGRKKV